MEKILLNGKKYVLEKNVNDCFCFEEVESLMTDYFIEFDYILGDFSYDKLRLKGFCNKKNKRFREINDINGLENYVKEYCSYKANYFLLKKVDN